MKKPAASLLIISILVGLCLAAGVQAQSGDGGQAGAFLRRGVSSRALAMGGAFTALSDDPSSGYWNPAGLAFLQFPEINASYTLLSLDRSYSYFAGALPLERYGTVGVALINFGVGGIEGRDNQGEITGSLSNSENAFYASWGYALMPNLSAGLSIKYLSHSLAGYRSSGFGLDLGLLYRYSPRLSLGVAVQDAYAKVGWNTSSALQEKFPSLIRAGVCLRPLKNGAAFTLDYATIQNEGGKIRVGAEIPILLNFGVRAGFDGSRLTGGGFVSLPLDKNFYEADLSFGKDPMDFSYVYRLTIRAKFGHTSLDFAPVAEPFKPAEAEGQVGMLFSGFTGRIIKMVDNYPNYALINAGESSGLRKGLMLEVYRSEDILGDARQQRVLIGEVKVVQVRGEISAVMVDWLKEGYFLKTGDFVFKKKY